MTMEPGVVVSIRMPLELAAEVERAAAAEDRSRSSIVRIGTRWYLRLLDLEAGDGDRARRPGDGT